MTHILMAAVKAQELAAELNAKYYDDWTYEAVDAVDNEGNPALSFINIYDEEGLLLGQL